MSLLNIILLIVFIAVTLFVYVIMRLFLPETAQIRLKQLADTEENKSDSKYRLFNEKFDKFANPFAKLSLPEEGWENSAIRLRFMHAGYRSQTLPLYFFAAKTLLALGFLAVFFLYAGISDLRLNAIETSFFSLLLLALGYYFPNMILNRLVFVRQRELFENFPDAIDLMTVCVEAGLGMDAAMRKVSEEIRIKCIPLAEELHLVNLEIRAGGGREKALQNLAVRTGLEEVEALVTMLIQTDRFGTSVADALRVHSDMLRTKRRLRAEEAAAKIALKLLFPLIFCIFPALFLVIMGPAVIQIFRILLPTMATQ